MNVLTDMLIKGDVFLEYAFLSFELLFTNESKTALSAEYRFALPEGALISNIKIIGKDGRIIRTSVISRSHAEKLYEEGGSAVLRRLDDTIYSLRLDVESCDTVKIIISVYAPLVSNGEGAQLIIPLAMASGVGKSNRQAEIELNIRGAESAVSTTHTLDLSNEFGEICVKTGKGAADRDFCINIKRGRKNTAIVSRDGVKSQLLCKVYPDNTIFGEGEKDYKKLLLIYDGQSLYRGASAAAKELMCALLDSFSGEYMVALANDGFCVITDGFCRLEEERTLITALSEDFAEGRILTKQELMASVDNGTLPIFICGGELSRNPFGDEFCGSGMCVVTMGGVSYCKEADEIANLCGGKRRHIFGGDDIATCAEQIIREFSKDNRYTPEALIYGTEALVIGNADKDAGVLIYAEGFGDPTIKEVELVWGNRRERIVLDAVEVYKGFAPIGLVYAQQACSKLEEKLSVCSPDEVCEIRKQMEDIGVRFSALNPETAMAVTYGETTAKAVRVVIEDGACRSFEAFEGRVSAFKEREERLSRKEIAREISLYADFIVRNMRAGGAICASGEIDPRSVRYQTLVCCLALISAGLYDRYREIITKGAEYLKACGEDFEITNDVAVAREKLGALLGDAPIVVDGIPDILTASKLLWQKTGEKEGYFC